jgi:hypothetical protein
LTSKEKDYEPTGKEGEGVSRFHRDPTSSLIFGDDIGVTNVSASSLGLMGYRTPNIPK